MYICFVLIFLLPLYRKHKGIGFSKSSPEVLQRHINQAARLPKAVYKERQIIPGLPVDMSG